ncbi:MAG: dihydrodipicolinate synthase family protein [Rikenellaceae bacterium]
MKNHQPLKGLVAAAFTPMDKNGDVNLSVIDKYADYIAKNNMQGVFVCGTTGESLSLTICERKQILEKWVSAASRRFKVIAHVGCNSVREAMDLAAHAEKCGSDAIAAMPPCFFRPANVKNLIAFFTPIASSAPNLPFYYYNIPSMAGVDLSVAEFLSEGAKAMPNLVGTKYTHNNLMEMRDCITLNGGKFEVLHGYDETMVAGLALGAVAGVGSTYNYIPDVYHGIMNAMSRGDIEKARELQTRSIEVVKVIIKHGGGLRGGKAIMNLIGIECGNCRTPVAPMTEDEYNSLRKELDEIKFTL